MIGRIRGKVIDSFESELVIDVHGVGYEVSVPLRVLASLRQSQEEVSLIIYTDVRENAIQLYGFQTALERHVFLLLKKVKGIGSKLALSVLSALRAEEILKTIGRQDVSGLQQVPGVGKKTAERIIVELREQVGEMVGNLSAELPRGIEVERYSQTNEQLEEQGPSRDVLLALEKLGFPRERARNALKLAEKESAAASRDAGDLLRAALAFVE